MKNPLSFLFRQRDHPQDSVSAAPTFYFGTSTSGKSVNPRNAVQVSAVYACVRVIAETIASLPIGVYEETDNGSRKATEHPLYRILHDEPNSEMTSFVMRESMLSHLLLWGNSYSQIIRSGKNKIVSLYPLLPDRMEVDRDKAGRLTYTYTTTEGQPILLRPEDVLHIPGLGFDGIMGYSPIALEKNAIGLGIAAEEYGSKFFQNGARPSGVLTHPNTIKDPKRLRESWNAAYGGSSNGSKVAILEESMTFTPISLPNNEAQFLETRKFQVEEICRIFRVPPHLIGDMNRALFVFSEKGHFYVQFNIDGLMRGDYKSRMEGYALGINNGFLSPNDVRRLENMNPIPDELGGNQYLVNGALIPITLAGIGQAVAAAKAAEQAQLDADNPPPPTGEDPQEQQEPPTENMPKRTPRKRKALKKEEPDSTEARAAGRKESTNEQPVLELDKK